MGTQPSENAVRASCRLVRPTISLRLQRSPALSLQLSVFEEVIFLSQFFVRGRNARYRAPPAQIPSTRNYRTGLLPWVLTSKRLTGRMSDAEGTASPILLCGLAYPPQLLGHAHPALCPVHAVLRRVPLGQAASLHRLRRPLMALVRQLRRYYPPVRLPVAVHWGRASSDFPPRPAAPYPTGSHAISRFSREVCLCMLRFCDRARSPALLP